jgi:hypothetical protein
MFHLFRWAIHPFLSLRACVEDWAAISQDLREPPRRRPNQTEELEAKCFSLY